MDGEGGYFSKKRSNISVNPLSFGYEITQGVSFAALAKSGKKLRIERNGDLAFEGRSGEVRLSFYRRGDQLCVSGYSDANVTANVRSWKTYRDRSYPAVVQIDTKLSWGRIRHITYTLHSVVDNPEKKLNDLVWKEGSLVKDGDSQTVYSVINGQLVPNKVFNDLREQLRLQSRLKMVALAVAPCVLIGSLVLWRRRTAARP